MGTTPLKSTLLAAQRNWVDVLTDVIADGKTVPITQDGEVVAYVVPAMKYHPMADLTAFATREVTR